MASCAAMVDDPFDPYTGDKWIPGGEPARYRGVNITCADETALTAEDVARWKAWGINLARINFNKDSFVPFQGRAPTPEKPWLPYGKNRQKLASWLGYFNEHRIEVMICLDDTWGDDHVLGSMWWFGGNNEALKHRIRLGQAMAEWVGADWPLVRYLEVWNEPHPYDDLYKTYFLGAAIGAIREKNSQITLVIMAPADWGMVSGFVDWNGVSDPKVAYSTHFYKPHTYTHQGVNGNPRLPGASWPGYFKDFAGSPSIYCDRAAYASYASPLADMRKRTGKRVFVTEFGALRWAAGNEAYLADAISVFEENGYDWLFHSISGWNGWNPSFDASEAESTRNFGAMKSSAFTVMTNAWAKNGP
jgi:hypothetical protein